MKKRKKGKVVIVGSLFLKGWRRKREMRGSINNRVCCFPHFLLFSLSFSSLSFLLCSFTLIIPLFTILKSMYRVYFTNCSILAETGEEGEDTVFSCRGKLYHFDGKEWKERGVGVFKVNVRDAANNNKDESDEEQPLEGKAEREEEEDDKGKSDEGDKEPTKKTARVIMRADGVWRVILNIPIFKGMKAGDPSGAAPKGKQVHFAGFEEGRSVPFLFRVCYLSLVCSSCSFFYTWVLFSNSIFVFRPETRMSPRSSMSPSKNSKRVYELFLLSTLPPFLYSFHLLSAPFSFLVYFYFYSFCLYSWSLITYSPQ